MVRTLKYYLYSAIEYIRENHNIDKFIYDFRNVIFENIEREIEAVSVVKYKD